MTVEVLNPLNHVSAHGKTRGTFMFVDLPPGPAIVHAYANGFGPYYGEMTVEAGKQYDVSIGLRLEGRAMGHVLDSSGNLVLGPTSTSATAGPSPPRCLSRGRTGCSGSAGWSPTCPSRCRLRSTGACPTW